MTHEREITLFGKLADPLGSRIFVGGADCDEQVRDVRARVAALEPSLGVLLADPRVRACIDGRVAADSAFVGPGLPVEFIPVVSGG